MVESAIATTDYISYKIDVGKTLVNVYLDFSKVHSTLLHKIKHYGIHGLAYKLMESYLEINKSLLSLKTNVLK